MLNEIEYKRHEIVAWIIGLAVVGLLFLASIGGVTMLDCGPRSAYGGLPGWGCNVRRDINQIEPGFVMYTFRGRLVCDKIVVGDSTPYGDCW